MPKIETGLAAHQLLSPNRPMAPSTYTAHVVRVYTNASGKYVATAQQARSHFRAQPLVRLRKGVGGGSGDGERLIGMSPFEVRDKEGIWIIASRVVGIIMNE
jgi:hypothetical protein